MDTPKTSQLHQNSALKVQHGFHTALQILGQEMKYLQYTGKSAIFRQVHATSLGLAASSTQKRVFT